MRYQRYVKRLVIGWLVLTPLCYFFVLPWLITQMEVKIRLQNYTACVSMMKEQNPDADTEADNEKFCHCVIDGLTLEKRDLVNIALQKPVPRLTDYAQDQANRCAEQALDAAKSKEPEVIYFNN